MAEIFICYRHIMEHDGAIEFLVRLPDGYLISCGNSSERAGDVASALELSYEPKRKVNLDTTIPANAS